MDWTELLAATQLEKRIEVTIINPVRKDDSYKKGRMIGYKSGIIGGGHSNFKKGVPCSFDSSKRKWIKRPKVLVEYNCFTFGTRAKMHSDWIDIDNCTFEIIDDYIKN